MKTIDYYIKKVKSEDIFGGDEHTKAYPFREDGIILVKKKEKDFEELKKRIKKCKNLGINIPEYYDYKLTDGSDYWILEELAPGEQLATLINNDNGQKIVNDIPYEHIEKYINDSYLLHINGIGVEPRRRNIFYDKERGFTIIDVGICNYNKKQDSLEDVNNFFETFSRVLFVKFTKDEKGRNIQKKTYLNMIKAFENGHPFFKKYCRWIYRNNIGYANALKEIGYDLSLDNREYDEFTLIINKLIDDIVEEKVNNPTDLFSNKNTGYIQLLSSSINYCSQFNLYDTRHYTLEKYVEKQVFGKIKLLFLNNPEDKNLKELYYKVRKKELDPNNIYPIEIVNKTIERELNALSSQNSRVIK